MDVYLLQDVAAFCNVIAKGRYLSYGQMTFTDIGKVAILVDMIARYIMDNMKLLTE